MSEIIITPEEKPTDFLSRPLIASINLDWEKTIYLLLITLAIVTRFWALGSRVMSHDESLHTQFAYQYYDGQGYQHTPLMHGPFLFHITAVSYWLFGDSDFAARAPVALFGIILVMMPYLLRPWLGRIGAIFTSFIFVISPYITYYSRYIRHDIYVIVWAMIVFIAIWYYFRDRQDKYLWWFVAGTALMFSTKEVAFIYVAIFGSFLAIRLFLQIIPAAWFRENFFRLRGPLLVFLLGLILLGAGFVAKRAVTMTEESVATVEATEGFAVNPDAETAAQPEMAPSGSASIFRWGQLLGIAVLGIGLFLIVNALRPMIDGYPEFDLIILFSTLLLPLASPFLTSIAGWNPTDYTLNKCELAGQESMNAFQLLVGRLGNTICWSSFFQSGIIRSGIFLVLAMAVSILIGLWWNKKRWIIAAFIFNGIILVLFTSVFTNLGGWTTGVIGSLGYWLEQQGVQRGSQPSFYYLFVVPFYEFLPLLFSLLAIRLWAQKERINQVIGYWIGLLLIGLLLYSMTNWFYVNSTANLGDASSIPGLIAAGLIFVGGILYWFFQVRRRLITEYELQKSVIELFDPRSILDFVPFLVWWLLLTWLAYSYAGEKMPWLSTHFVIPMGLLTGWYFNEKLSRIQARDLFTRNSLLLFGLTALLVIVSLLVIGPLFLGRIQLGDQNIENLTAIGRLLGSIIVVGLVFFLWRRVLLKVDPRLRNPIYILSLFALLSLLTIRFAYMASFTNADYTNEFMVYAHGAPATKSVVLKQVEELSMRLNGDKSIKVAFDSDVSWPLTWYLREYPNRVFFGENPSQSLNDSPVIIVGAQNWGAVEPYLGNNYEYTEHTFLWWPMEEYRQISLNAIFGDPRTPPDQRRGLGNAGVREALWDIFFYRDYQKYGEVFGGTYTAGEWPLRHNLRLYIRKDTLPTMWDYGVGTVAAGGITDPYAEGELIVAPVMSLNTSGIAGSGAGELASPRNMAMGPDGRIYVADSGNHRIQVFEADGRSVTSWGQFGTEAGQFNEPWGITVDDENVYVADTWNHRLQKFTLDGDFVASFGTSGSPSADGSDSGLGLFFGPRSIILLDDNRLLVTDTGNHRMQVLDRDGNFLQVVGGFGNQLGQMNEPVGLSSGPDGSIYLADTWNSRIQQFTPDLFAINDWFVDAWNGTSINNKPYSAVDSAGRVYVTDPEGYRVLVFAPDGTYLARFGTFGTEITNFGLPNGITIDDQDNVYIADAGNHRILKFAPLWGAVIPVDEESDSLNDNSDIPGDSGAVLESGEADDSGAGSGSGNSGAVEASPTEGLP